MLDSKTAIVTGGASGIGRAIAQKYAAHGADVVIGDITQEPRMGGQPTHELVREAGGSATFFEADVTSLADMQALVEQTAEEHGSVDVMVNNAGILQQTRLHETEPEDWERLMRINVDGVFYGTKAALTQMVDQGSGSIVNISSISGKIGRANAPAYCASKGAVTMLTRQNAIDYGPEGIRVNAVGPGGTLTAMVHEVMSEERQAYLEDATPLRRLAEPEEIADVATFLASDMASYVNGHVLIADGGFSIV